MRSRATSGTDSAESAPFASLAALASRMWRRRERNGRLWRLVIAAAEPFARSGCVRNTVLPPSQEAHPTHSPIVDQCLVQRLVLLASPVERIAVAHGASANAQS